MNHFFKPELNFPKDYEYPLIAQFVSQAYRYVECEASMLRFIHVCLNIADNAEDGPIKEEHKKIAYTLYSVMTGKSYESAIPNSI